jgi:two-component system phosphate regulon sensor histidine kinase PhoR
MFSLKWVGLQLVFPQSGIYRGAVLNAHANVLLTSFSEIKHMMGDSEQPRKNGINPKGVKKPASPANDEADDSGHWIAEVSHELRLPIANIKLLVETLLDGALDDPSAARRMLMRTKEEVDRLQHLVVNLLSAEQVVSRREVQAQWVPLYSAARYAVDTTQRLASDKRITVEMEIEPEFRVYANPEQLDQVVLNLVENAIKFTPKNGRVKIKSGSSIGSFLVEDSGIGMAASEIPKIFQRFYRIDRAKSKGSTGLGLSIVKHIADLHGAKISVTSQEGEGSTFFLEFPSPRSIQ